MGSRFFMEWGKNTFTWKVDRDNPKIKLPSIYTGTVTYEENNLTLEIIKGSQTIYSIRLKPVPYY